MSESSFKVERLNQPNMFAALSIGAYASSLKKLYSEGFQPVDIARVAQQRLDLGAYHEISWTGTRTTDLFVYRDGSYFLAHGNLSSLLYDLDALEFIQAYNANYREVPYQAEYISSEIAIPEDGLVVPTSEFDTHPVIRFLFKEHAKEYKAWLMAADIPAFPILLPNYSLAQTYPENFIRPLIIRCTDNWSGIITSNADLHLPYGYRGWAEAYEGNLLAPERFERRRLDTVHKLVPLENRDYTLAELETLFINSPHAALFNPVLRTVRNDGSLLPANFNTWAQN
jgi:hypothetical protein